MGAWTAAHHARVRAARPPHAATGGVEESPRRSPARRWRLLPRGWAPQDQAAARGLFRVRPQRVFPFPSDKSGPPLLRGLRHLLTTLGRLSLSLSWSRICNVVNRVVNLCSYSIVDSLQKLNLSPSPSLEVRAREVLVNYGLSLDYRGK
jgi:hypothetical protein